MFTAAIFITAKKWKNNPNAHQLMNEQTTCDTWWNIIMEYYLSTERNEVTDMSYDIDMP